MRSADHSTNPPCLAALDLETCTEATRRALYDLVVAVHLTPPAKVSLGDWYSDYSPDQAGLVAQFTRGRWLATWPRLVEAASDLPEDRRQALVRIQAVPEAPLGVAF